MPGRRFPDVRPLHSSRPAIFHPERRWRRPRPCERLRLSRPNVAALALDVQYLGFAFCGAASLGENEPSSVRAQRPGRLLLIAAGQLCGRSAAIRQRSEHASGGGEDHEAPIGTPNGRPGYTAVGQARFDAPLPVIDKQV
jgi:hypothetical protein